MEQKDGALTRKALITGGTRGIGAAIAIGLLQRGYQVTVTGRSKPVHDTGATFMFADFTSLGGISDFVAELSERACWGVVVNNAGINKTGDVAEVSDLQIGEMVNVNLLAPIMITRAVVGYLRRADSPGQILNVASIWSVSSRAERSIYSATKSGLVGFTRGAALDAASSGIRVNALSPGFTDTDLTRQTNSEEELRLLESRIPMGMMADVSNIADVAAFLVSRESAYVTGQNFVVDGGYTIQ